MENKFGDKGFKGFGKGFGKEIQRYLEEPSGTPSWEPGREEVAGGFN